jgi:hypothetical protein
MNSQEYKGFRITKRNGMDMKRRAISGYRVYNVAFGQQNFATLTEARAWVDSKVAA